MPATGWMYQENCDCPSQNTTEWLEALQCPSSFEQLDVDLKPFTKIDMRLIEKEVNKRWPKRPGLGALMHYVVKDGKVRRDGVAPIRIVVKRERDRVS